MRLLVTGAAGFIGANFVRYWRRCHPSDAVAALDALTYAGVRSSLDPSVPFVRADIGDMSTVESVLRAERIDVVVNFAAESHNSRAVLDPGRFFETNVLGTQRLLEACRRVGLARFHHVSTCEVYGDLALDDPGSFAESAPYRPRTPYNASKAGADHAVRAYFETFGLPVTITVCANNYGPYQFPEKVIPLFATRALSGLPLPVYASSANRREWLHVDDHCAAIARVLSGGEVGATYNVGSGVEVSVSALASAVLDVLGLPHSMIATVPDRPGHDRRYLLNSGRLRSTLGWAPAVDFAAGLAATVEWYAANRSWWEPLRDRHAVNETAWTPA
jgi:dTDP-glucose 4,6-dehydratase